MFVPNLRTVEMYGRLCLECRGCRKRAWKTASELNEAARRRRNAEPLSDMTNIDALPFRCRGCKSTSAAWLIPMDENEAVRFVAGGRIGTSLVSAPPPLGCGRS